MSRLSEGTERDESIPDAATEALEEVEKLARDSSAGPAVIQRLRDLVADWTSGRGADDRTPMNIVKLPISWQTSLRIFRGSMVRTIARLWGHESTMPSVLGIRATR